jgi:hypothetical protein
LELSYGSLVITGCDVLHSTRRTAYVKGIASYVLVSYIPGSRCSKLQFNPRRWDASVFRVASNCVHAIFVVTRDCGSSAEWILRISRIFQFRVGVIFSKISPRDACSRLSFSPLNNEASICRGAPDFSEFSRHWIPPQTHRFNTDEINEINIRLNIRQKRKTCPRAFPRATAS